MDVGLFDFDLPEDRIAMRPVEPRDAARLLVVPSAPATALRDAVIRDLPELLQPGDVLVVNDTRVVAGELHGQRIRDGNSARASANLLQRMADDTWRVLLRPAKKVRVGECVIFSGDKAVCEAEVTGKADGGVFQLRFDVAGDALDARLNSIGRMPLPPYIASRRTQDDRDAGDYQTIFAEYAGAVAAPTAGLHFTEGLIRRLAAREIVLERVTLHVGGGTFLPVRVDDTNDHVMHAEWGEVSADTADRLNAARREGRRIVCVGTTSLRLLESAAGEDGTIVPYAGETDIFITPGYRFQVGDVLLTNFHLPRSTLFMLVAAFSGLDVMKSAYAHAIETGYRFYSYGDACLLEKA